MNRNLKAGLAAGLLVVAFAATATAAEAAPHWYVGSTVLVKKMKVKTEAGLSFSNIIPGTTIGTSCKIKDAEVLENPASGGPGIDTMKAFKVTSCGPNPCPVNAAGVQGKLKVKALKLPWATKLVEVPPIADEISGIELEFVCSKTGVLTVLSGTLSPWVNTGSLEFTAATGTLGASSVTGFDNFLPATISAKNP